MPKRLTVLVAALFIRVVSRGRPQEMNSISTTYIAWIEGCTSAGAGPNTCSSTRDGKSRRPPRYRQGYTMPGRMQMAYCSMIRRRTPCASSPVINDAYFEFRVTTRISLPTLIWMIHALPARRLAGAYASSRTVLLLPGRRRRPLHCMI